MSDGVPLPVVLHGIPHCDQVKKARAWLTEHDVAYTFHDFKKAGLSPAVIAHWLTTVDWQTLVNRKGTTWRALPEARRAAITDASHAALLMLESPSIVKRPVLQRDADTLVGFDAALYQALFNLPTTATGAPT